MTLIDDLRNASLTCSLTEEQLEDLVAIGESRDFAPGDELFREGHSADRMWMLLAGEIEVSQQVGRESNAFGTMAEPGQWAGGHAAWGSADEHAVFLVTGRAITHGRCYVIEATELRGFVDRWLPLSRHLLDAVYQTVRRVDATSRQREALLALGTLAAGLAHEINNPASASMRALDALRETNDDMFQALVGLARHGVDAEHFLVLDRIRDDLQQRDPAGGGALDAADREDAVCAWMERRSIPDAWRLAPVFAAKGADEAWFDELESLTGADGLEAALRWIACSAGVADLLSELTEATTRITNLVRDVKTYSQMDRGSLQCIDLASGIDSTLTMLSHRSQGIEVVREYDELPDVEVYAAELNQVWTNLIGNALDAMAGHGVLRLVTALDGDGVVVEITDSGPGIDPSIRHRVFEPFFTTKEVGTGTGLGLDVARRIVVDRHGGTIELDSSPGSTTARVRLPLRR